MEDQSIFNNSQARTISEGLQNFIDSMVEEIVLEGKPFDTQKKYLKKFSENEGLDYEKLEADITTFIEILDSLKTAFSNLQVKLAEEKGGECHISEATVKKLVSHSQKNLPKKEKKNKTGLWIGLCLAAAMVTALVVLLVRPKHTPADPDTQAYQICQTVEDYRAYMRDYGRNALHYTDAKAFVDRYEADSIQNSLAQQQAEAEMKKEDEAYQKCTTVAACDGYLKIYPQGRYVNQVMAKKNELEKSLPNVEITTSGSSLIIKLGDVSFKMIKVEGGTFRMGAQNDNPNGYNYSKDDDADWFGPVHTVELSSYYLAETEVTQALWKAVLNKNPSCFKGDNRPVESVNISDCQMFIDSLNSLTGKRFRLPTEAEWEYAARGGKKSKGFEFAGSNNPDEVGWTWSNSPKGTKPVKQLKPNELGLYDMTGNVLEWCSDKTDGASKYKTSEKQVNPQGLKSGTRRIDRGGCWEYGAMEVWYRHDFIHSSRINRTGLRLALSE